MSYALRKKTKERERERKFIQQGSHAPDVPPGKSMNAELCNSFEASPGQPAPAACRVCGASTFRLLACIAYRHCG